MTRVGAGRLAVLSALLLLGACEGDIQPTRVFPPLSYTYLTPLHLNVLSLDVQDHSASAGPDDVAPLSPVTPQQALTTMAHDRLFPGGSAGQAVFIIDNAIIDRTGGTLDGSLSVHLDIVGADGRKLGYAEAHVSRHNASAATDEDRPAGLYELTKQMMADMNVEFEYQVRQSLGAFLQTDSAIPGAVVAQPLVGTTIPPSLGVASPSQTSGSGPPMTTDQRTLSPPPGFLTPPGSGVIPGGIAPDGTSTQSFAPPTSPVYQPPALPTPNPNGPIQLAPTY